MSNLVIRNVRPMGGETTSVTIRDGRIAGYGQTIEDRVETVDGGGAILIPGLVEAHTHMDKTLLGMGWYRNEVGPRLIDKIENRAKLGEVEEELKAAINSYDKGYQAHG